MTDEIKAWHFVGDTLLDGSPIPPIGEWLEFNGKVEICQSGLHASKRIIDALQYAPGDTICRVTCRSIVEKQNDKFVCRARRIDAMIDGEELLRQFARQCALDVIHLWDAPDIARQYLETGDEKLRDAARDAAWASARNAIMAAAWDATWATAWDAARAAARAAARDAARDAAWANAGAAAGDAAVAKQNKRLEQMVLKAMQ